MGYKDPAAQREYQRKWMAKRRADWLADKACVKCGRTDDLHVDHIDPTKKISHNVWSWSKQRRDAELAKCQVLCRRHHEVKNIADMPVTMGIIPYEHGTKAMYQRRGCRCDLCCATMRAVWRRQGAARRLRKKNALP